MRDSDPAAIAALAFCFGVLIAVGVVLTLAVWTGR